MASEKLTGFIISNELANFRGTPKKLNDLRGNLQRKFPETSQKFFRNPVPNYLEY